jgi:aspartate aminotransferase-like enzyme
MLLLNPGPVTLTERVRNSLLQTDLCHRESEFSTCRKRRAHVWSIFTASTQANGKRS